MSSVVDARIILTDRFYHYLTQVATYRIANDFNRCECR